MMKVYKESLLLQEHFVELRLSMNDKGSSWKPQSLEPLFLRMFFAINVLLR